jgi:hypothetical protein
MALVRQQAEREARGRADEMLAAEIARARADAEARLAAEVAAVRADAESRRAAELATIQTELDLARDAARTIAHAAATGAISAGVARAEASIPQATARVAADAAARLAAVAFSGAAGTLRVSSVVVRSAWERLPPRAAAAIVVLALLAATAMVLDVRVLTASGVSAASGTLGSVMRSARAAAATAMDAAAARMRALVPGRTPNRATAGATRPERQPAADAPGSRSPDAPSGALTGSGPGLLVVFSRIPLEISVDGRRIGTTEDGQIVVPSGRHRVGLVNARLNYRGEVVLNVRPAAVTSHNVTLPEGLLQVIAEPGAEVRIEGERAGVAPLGPLPVPLGTREVVVRHPEFGERRQIVEVRYGETAQVTLLRRVDVPRDKAFPLP